MSLDHTILNLQVRNAVYAYERIVGNPNTYGNVYQLGANEPSRRMYCVPTSLRKLASCIRGRSCDEPGVLRARSFNRPKPRRLVAEFVSI